MILKVSETMNFTKAAESLFVSQPTLTYQIKLAENELGFSIFNRTQKSVSLTPAGKTFVSRLRNIHQEYQEAVEEGENYSDKYNDDIVISLPYRSCLHLLPQAMIRMSKEHPSVLITPHFEINNRLNDFISGHDDIIFDDYEVIRNLKETKIIHLYQSRIYLVCNKNDKLAKKQLIHINDLKGQTLMVGGGSQLILKEAQKLVLQNLHLPFFNSNDHDTTLTNIAARKGIVLAPGFLHDRNDGFAWIPFDFPKTIDCCLGLHEDDKRQSVEDFVSILLDLYDQETTISL